MSEHFTRKTLAAALWCGKCHRVTGHRIDGGRKGPCLECIARLEKRHQAQAAAPVEKQVEKQAELFA